MFSGIVVVWIFICSVCSVDWQTCATFLEERKNTFDSNKNWNQFVFCYLREIIWNYLIKLYLVHVLNWHIKLIVQCYMFTAIAASSVTFWITRLNKHKLYSPICDFEWVCAVCKWEIIKHTELITICVQFIFGNPSVNDDIECIQLRLLETQSQSQYCAVLLFNTW